MTCLALVRGSLARVQVLGLLCAGWADANVAFIQSKGYSLSKKVSEVKQPTLVAWGAQDQILKPSDAQRFAAAIPHAKASTCSVLLHSAHVIRGLCQRRHENHKVALAGLFMLSCYGSLLA